MSLIGLIGLIGVVVSLKYKRERYYISIIILFWSLTVTQARWYEIFLGKAPSIFLEFKQSEKLLPC
jgi:hypothetical protein